jgi:hypothetical protein
MKSNRVNVFCALGPVALMALAGCGTKLPSETSKLDLTSSGVPISIDAPNDGITSSEGSGVVIRWGAHGEGGSLSFSRRATELKCTALDDDCKVLEQDGTSLIKEKTIFKKKKIDGSANIKFGSHSFSCLAQAGTIEDVRRLVSACKGATATSAMLEPPTLTSAVAPIVDAPPVLEEVSSKATDRQGPFNFSIRVPEGHTTIESGLSLVYASPKGTPLLKTVTVTVSPTDPVKSLSIAEKEVRSLDIGGLDTIAEKRELSKTSFFLHTAPRGTGKLMTVYVYAAGKKRTAFAKCYGSEASKKTLVDMCSSLKVD